MLLTSDVKVYVLPVFIGLLSYKSLVVCWVHITQIVCA